MAPMRSITTQTISAARVTPNCSTAPAEARKRVSRSGSFIQSINRTGRVGGRCGPRISATSTTDVA
jgi:hypothetical protein